MSLDRLSAWGGCVYLAAGTHTDQRIKAFIAQEDTALSHLTGGENPSNLPSPPTDYLTDIGLSGVTLKQSALIVAPLNEFFESLTFTGSIIGYL